MAFRVVFSPEAGDHIGGLRAHERTRLFEEIERQLLHEPEVATRHRKAMQPTPPSPDTACE